MLLVLVSLLLLVLAHSSRALALGVDRGVVAELGKDYLQTLGDAAGDAVLASSSGREARDGSEPVKKTLSGVHRRGAGAAKLEVLGQQREHAVDPSVAQGCSGGVAEARHLDVVGHGRAEPQIHGCRADVGLVGVVEMVDIVLASEGADGRLLIGERHDCWCCGG